MAAPDPKPTTNVPLETGGSLLLAWQLQGKHVLVIGGGEVASGRITLLLQASAHVTVIAPHPLHPLIAEYLERFPPADEPAAATPASPPTEARPSLRHVAREYHADDLSPTSSSPILPTPCLVLTALPATARLLSSAICATSRARRIPVNVADVPAECDVYFGSTLRRGSVQVLVSTNGRGPRLARRVRETLQHALDTQLGGVEGAVARAGRIRGRLRERVPGAGREDVKGRMDWMIRVSDAYSLSDLCEMDDVDMEMLLDHYERGLVPRLSCLRAMRDAFDPFDGSFGFCVGVG